jgi:hypothetical protein
MENRLLQTACPTFLCPHIWRDAMRSKLDNYANDQFIGRNGFIKVKSATDVTEGKLEANGVYRCRDNYLMEKLNEPNQQVPQQTRKML